MKYLILVTICLYAYLPDNSFVETFCSDSSLFGGCSAVCTDAGTTASCNCGFFTCDCGCEANGVLNYDNVTLTITKEQITLLDNFVNFLIGLQTTNTTDLANNLKSLKRATISNDLSSYKIESTEIEQLLRLLSTSEKASINQWFENNSINAKL